LSTITTTHLVESQGYAVYKKKTKLKEEFAKLDISERKEAIMKAKKDKIEINDSVEVCELVFTGDTRIEPLLLQSNVLNARVLLIELTMPDRDEPVEPFERFGHIHIKNLEEHQDKFNNEVIVLHHFASK